jgi:hypothetical protein
MKLKKVSLTIVLIGLSGVVFADWNSSGSKAPEFTDTAGTAMSFDYTETGDDQASLGTCAMNPTTPNTNGVLMEEPTVEPESQPVSFVEDAQPLLSRMAPQSSDIRTNGSLVSRNVSEDSTSTIPLNPTTPEPTTLLIIGMSIVGFVPLVKRYRRKQTTH